MRSSEGDASGLGDGRPGRGRGLGGGRWRRLAGRGLKADRDADQGFVTAEAAVVIPTLAAFALALMWGLMAAVAQIECLDAARAGARAAARSEAEPAVLAAARSAAPAGARVELRRDGDLWRVRVEAPTPGPRALALTLSGDAAALAEDTVGEPMVGEER
ncbi:TadE family type IV pilus minor pilin [Streptomyces melanogenes]|uniref:TadE family type IV pilus minor pilin n=1 Tax=Streptomyces melanogenes TaxID=67326 RepID=UPI0019CCE901|nr:TadE family type IV pilus minor pilin [Streptomyces melanogenes]GGP74783.1 membrane protein [Streptomyces melanogenes]